MQYLHSIGCPWDACSSWYAAASGNLGMLQWLLSQDSPCPLPSACMDVTISNQQWPVMQYLHSERWPLKGSVYYQAASHPQVLFWLHVPASTTIPKDAAELWSLSQAPSDAVMVLGDMGVPLPEAATQRLLLARRTFCTFHGLLRWACSALASLRGGHGHANDCSAPGMTGKHLLIRLSMLPQELINKIARLAGLQQILL